MDPTDVIKRVLQLIVDVVLWALTLAFSYLP